MTYMTIESLFTGICDAIREKEGTTDLISHQDIPDRIGAISAGGSGIFNVHFTKIDFDLEDMSTWTQVNSAVSYTHNYENGVNKFYPYKGGGGYERWVKKLPALEIGKNYMLRFNMWSPTGFEYGHYNYSYDSIQAYIISSIPYKSSGFKNYINSANAFISFDASKASSVPVSHNLFFSYMQENAGDRYVVIDTGGIKDGVPIELDISCISLYEVDM